MHARSRSLPIALFVVGALFGIGSLLAYVGAPIHQLVYNTTEEVKAFDALCGGDTATATLICRGTAAFIPMVWAFLQMLSPFWFVIGISAAALLAITIRAGLLTGRFEQTIRLRIIMFPLLFAVAVWLIGTTLSLTTTYNLRTPDTQKVGDLRGGLILPPFRRIYEPTPEVYASMSDNTLAALRANFMDLEARGCIRPMQNAQGQDVVTAKGARVMNLSMLCMQASFFSRVGLQLILVTFFLFHLLVVGRFLLRVMLALHALQPLLDLCLSFGLGALGWTAALWGLSLLGWLSPIIIGGLAVGIPLILYRISWSWLCEAWERRIHVRCAWNSVPLILGWLLVLYLALNFLNVVRPFPIGWDDLGSYLNRPRLLASYGAFIPSMSQFQWEYLTSLGFLLFGYDGSAAATFAMQINWSAGLLAGLAAYAAGRIAFGAGGGLITALLYITLPMTGHFSFADMKIDNASFFTITMSILPLIVAIFGIDGSDAAPPMSGKERRNLLVAAGHMAGLSFGIKATGILGVFFSLALIGGGALGWRGFASTTLLGFGLLAGVGPLSMREIATRLGAGAFVSQRAFILAMFLTAAITLLYAVRWNRAGWRRFVSLLAPYALGILLATAPWGIVNIWTNQSLSVGAALKAADPTAPVISYLQKDDVTASQFSPVTPTRFLPPELALDPEHPSCKTSARFEELDRYWGFGTGLSHYLLLPWRQVMNTDAYGYYVTLVPALLLFPLLLLLPYFWDPRARWLRFFMAATFVYVIQWGLVANGVIWYGIGMFLGLCMALEAFIRYAPDRYSKRLFAALIAASILIALINRLWQFDTQKNVFEYPMGKISAEALREVTIPQYDKIRQSVVTRHEDFRETQPYSYRIGTFISYFIPKNREILPLADHQMQFFNCINQERNHALTLRRLMALGFNSIIFDTNTQTIEKDPNGPLHQKVEAFVAFANDPALKLEIAVNDPGNGIAYILLPVSASAPPPTP